MDKKYERIKYIIEALPYIKKFAGKVFVIKFGGSILEDEAVKKAFIQDVSLMESLGIKIVIVHGGGKEISQRLNTLGIKSEFKEGYRITCDHAIEEVEMVLSGRINNELTLLLNNEGVKAVGLNGKDAGLIQAKKKFVKVDEEYHDIGNVGDVLKVESEIVELMINHSIIPVIAPIGFDKEGGTYNINADSVAAAICESMKAEKLVLMTDVDGLYLDFNDKESLITRLSYGDALEMVNGNKLSGGMIPKVQCCLDVIEGGTHSVHMINGLVRHSLLLEIFTDGGIGTMVTNEKGAV